MSFKLGHKLQILSQKRAAFRAGCCVSSILGLGWGHTTVSQGTSSTPVPPGLSLARRQPTCFLSEADSRAEAERGFPFPSGGSVSPVSFHVLEQLGMCLTELGREERMV